MSKFSLPFAEGLTNTSFFTPAAMLLAAIATGVIITVQSSPFLVTTLILFIFVGGTLTHTRWRSVLSLAARFELVIMFWIFLEPFLFGTTIVAHIATPFGSLIIYAEGIRLGILLGLRMMALLLLFLTTLSHMTLSDFINALRTLHVPTVLVGSLMVMLRYIPLFLEERSRMQEAQLLRGYQQGTRWEKITSLGYLVGSTIDRAFDRSITVFEAMTLRGFAIVPSNRVSGFHCTDAILLGIIAFIVVAIQFVLPIFLDVILSWSLL